MQTVIIVVHLMIVAVMIGAVLLQKSEGGGLGMGGGAGFMSSRGTANLLTRTTAILAAGCVGYFVCLTGRRAVYFGRTGENYIEPFPPAKP